MAAWTLPGRIADWTRSLSAGLDRRSRKYLPTIVIGMLLASGRRTVSCWFRAAGVSDDWQDHYYFLQSLGHGAERVATELLLLAVKQIPISHVGPYVKLAIDDSPTKRYGPKVELAGIHHNPTPGPSGSEFLYGHVWVTISWLVTHPKWGCIGLPLPRDVRATKRPAGDGEHRTGSVGVSYETRNGVRTDRMVRDCLSKMVRKECPGRRRRGLCETHVHQPGGSNGAIAVSRLRKDAALWDVPPLVKRRGKGRPRKYGANRISLARRGGHRQGWTTACLTLYGVKQDVTFKTFEATYRPAGGRIRVVIVKRSDQLFTDCGSWLVAFFCTDPTVAAETIIESMADRSAIEQNFHDVKEVHGAGQQQVRNVWSNVACWNLCGSTRWWNCGRGVVRERP